MRKKILAFTLSMFMIGMVGCAKKYQGAPAEDAKSVAAQVTTSEPAKVATEEPKQVAVTTPEPAKTPAPTQTPKTATSTTKKGVTTMATTQTDTGTTTTPTVPQKTIYNFTHINPNTTIKNNPKFNVSISNLNPKIGEDIKVIVKLSEPINISEQHGEIYGNNQMVGGANVKWSDDKKTYTDEVVIQNWPLQDGNKIDLYVFITDNSDKSISEYKFTLNVQQ